MTETTPTAEELGLPEFDEIYISCSARAHLADKAEEWIREAKRDITLEDILSAVAEAAARDVSTTLLTMGLVSAAHVMISAKCTPTEIGSQIMVPEEDGNIWMTKGVVASDRDDEDAVAWAKIEQNESVAFAQDLLTRMKAGAGEVAMNKQATVPGTYGTS